MSTRRAWACGLALACLLIPAPARAQKKAPGGARALLLSGGQRQHHGYRDQAFYLANLLEDTGRYQVTIVEDAAILEAPAMAKYDLILATADRRDDEFKLTEAQQRALLDWVKAGHGYVSIHGADNAPPDWLPEWKQMLGGIYSHVGQPDGKALTGTFTVRIADRDSPVTKGLDDFVLKDELYTNMQMLPGVKPLATIEHEGVTWKVAWTWQYGRGRVFHTSLGHRGFGPGKDDPLRDPHLAKLVLQGIDWVAEGSRTSTNGH